MSNNQSEIVELPENDATPDVQTVETHTPSTQYATEPPTEPTTEPATEEITNKTELVQATATISVMMKTKTA